ncbi:hypothetical protein PMZ80_008492 [Knufia obscura]|uniref:Uncharacterized protein n=2 Tax=Knufia TaxID=430999 RepID=A0AAN8ECE3_9EURO|nr:hypothetical protein PMZ80_008492 [Knufia obscura]KAK5951948.1 hypothetical protein OHC33_006834 [Knufia fluminis]
MDIFDAIRAAYRSLIGAPFWHRFWSQLKHLFQDSETHTRNAATKFSNWWSRQKHLAKVLATKSVRTMTDVGNDLTKSYEKAIPVIVFTLFQTGRAVNTAYSIYQTLRLLPIRTVQKVSMRYAKSYPALILWDISDTEVKVPTTNTWARLNAEALAQAHAMLVKCCETFSRLSQQEQANNIRRIAKDIVNFEVGIGHVYAPKRAFFIAAQMIDFWSDKNTDHYERYPKLQVGSVGEEKTRVFAVFIYCVFMITSGPVNMEQPHIMPNQAQEILESVVEQHKMEDAPGPKQYAEAKAETHVLRKAASFDSGYGGSPQLESRCVVAG